jgi:hypothetical protein
MAQRTYHPLAKVAFAAAALLTLLTLTIHGHRPPGSITGPSAPSTAHTQPVSSSTSQQ